MSLEGALNNSEQNSGEIKVGFCEDNMIVDNNSDNDNGSLVLLGYSTESVTGDMEPASFSCKQIGESIIMRSVEEWFGHRTDLDYDSIRTDNLCFNSDGISESNNAGLAERTISPLVSNSNSIIEDGAYINSWDDLVLDSDSGVLIAKNNPSLLSSQAKSECDLELPKAIVSDVYLNVSSRPQNVQLPLTKICEKQSTSFGSELKLKIKHISSENTTHKANERTKVKCISTSLPFIKIPRNCLMKGKILGKGDISLLSGNRPISFLKSPTNFNSDITNASQALGLSVDIIPDVNKTVDTTLTSKFTVIDKGQLYGTKLTKIQQHHYKSNVNMGETNINVAVPVESSKPKKNKSLAIKPSNSRSILKSSVSNKSVELPTDLATKICETPPSETLNTKNSNPLALVAISTNKGNDTTEIIIKTEDGENVFKGKTSDIMKATSSKMKVKVKLSQKKDKQSKTYNTEHDSAQVEQLISKVCGMDLNTLEDYDALSQGPLNCPIDDCNYSTMKGPVMKVHILQHYKIRPFKCNYPGCTWAFYTNFRLKRHQGIHSRGPKKKEFQCPVGGCGRRFTTAYNVNTHMKLHERPIMVTCQINGCDRAFQTRRGYEKHLKDHGIQYAPYVCSIEGCGKKYFTINSLNSHLRIHQHPEEELKCSYCEKRFEQPCRLKAHMNTHLGFKPYVCDFENCPWAFTTSSKLRRHQRKHTQTRKHICKVCNKSFLRSEHLKDHSLKHFVKRSFLCSIRDCGMMFSNKSTMYAHLKKHRVQDAKISETTVTTFPCPIDTCKMLFNTIENQRIHMQNCHVLTGLINNENSQDTIQLLSDDNLIALDGLPGNSASSGSGMVSFNSQEGLLVGMSDLVQCIPVMEQGDFSESNSSNNITTQVVFTDDMEDGDNQVMEESNPLNITETENIGSARTDIPYKAGLRDKQMSSLAGQHSRGLHSASDVVLSSGLLERGLLLQDELSGGDLYSSQEESGGLLSNVGELQVLLLDSSTREQTSEFEQSTINLRDLE
ncbi:protein suppressor of hairy wing-like [Macrosteles quadrilineatus]|uniref:protein suppressor of hairy wing-like n=1 Tax=Macrosteles quadrilineatus TaxID=74068 RepID=UPI0023E15D7C|nr:protein suppressor of hairy wing-like [Macrosteles quadrilineatus]